MTIYSIQKLDTMKSPDSDRVVDGTEPDLTRGEFLVLAALFVGGPNAGPEPLTECDVAAELAEEGWPDSCAWLHIFHRLHREGPKAELSEDERRCALAYFRAGEDGPEDNERLPSAREGSPCR